MGESGAHAPVLRVLPRGLPWAGWTGTCPLGRLETSRWARPYPHSDRGWEEAANWRARPWEVRPGAPAAAETPTARPESPREVGKQAEDTLSVDIAQSAGSARLHPGDDLRG